MMLDTVYFISWPSCTHKCSERKLNFYSKNFLTCMHLWTIFILLSQLLSQFSQHFFFAFQIYLLLPSSLPLCLSIKMCFTLWSLFFIVFWLPLSLSAPSALNLFSQYHKKTSLSIGDAILLFSLFHFQAVHTH